MDGKLLVVDTETSGLDPDVHSILSIGAAVWSPGRVLASLELFICDDSMEVQPDALRINQIDLGWLREHGVPPAQAVATLEAFVRRNFDLPDPGARVTIVGHNLSFDVPFLKRLYQRAGASYAATFSHRIIDTASILGFLILAGLLPLSGASSEEALEYFGISVPARHTGLGDAVATAELLDKLIEFSQRPCR
jgi:DNA polymerase III epsilon subunit-like protein